MSKPLRDAPGEPRITEGPAQPSTEHVQAADAHHAHERKPQQSVTLSAEEHERLLEQAKQAASYQDQYLRAAAEFDNAKKRLQRDREEFAQFASERFIKQLLPIIDSFELALKAIDQAQHQPDVSSHPPAPGEKTFARGAKAGLQLIFKQLSELLDKEGVKRIEALHKPFDHHYHEAIQQVPHDGVADNIVIEEVQAGYTLHGRVIRPSLVKVAKNARSEAGDQKSEPPA